MNYDVLLYDIVNLKKKCQRYIAMQKEVLKGKFEAFGNVSAILNKAKVCVYSSYYLTLVLFKSAKCTYSYVYFSNNIFHFLCVLYL